MIHVGTAFSAATGSSCRVSHGGTLSQPAVPVIQDGQ